MRQAHLASTTWRNQLSLRCPELRHWIAKSLSTRSSKFITAKPLRLDLGKCSTSPSQSGISDKHILKSKFPQNGVYSHRHVKWNKGCVLTYTLAPTISDPPTNLGEGGGGELEHPLVNGRSSQWHATQSRRGPSTLCELRHALI